MRLFAVCLALLAPSVAAAQADPEPLVEQVRSAIDRGVRFLRRTEGGRGNWEAQPGAGFNIIAAVQPGGASALATLALLNAGVPRDDPVIARSMEYLRKLPPRDTYVVGLQTMVFAEVADPADRERIQRNVDWLIKARLLSGQKLEGWGYNDNPGTVDNSNSQYALLGLHAGRSAGAKVDRQVWTQIRDFYRSTQTNTRGDEGGWSYRNERGQRQSTLTMTIAGLCGLQICSFELDRGQQGLQPDGTATNCGNYPENEAIRKALQWLRGPHPRDRFARFRFNESYHYYNAYGIERAGRLTGLRFLIPDHDWYREGSSYLVGLQSEDDSWPSSNLGHPPFPAVVNTGFALLFLSKGRTPVLISKWAHGPGESAGWNNKHFDAKNLADFASREMFKRQPLAWQAYDPRRLKTLTAGERLGEVGTLLQSPIVYMNGHDAPRLDDQPKRLLKQYVEEGGFLLAEACCGRAEFTEGFRRLMAELFPDNPLRPLSPEHAVWRMWKAVPPDFVPLEGIEMGCKTVVVFSPRPLAGYWEENEWADGRGATAFRLAGNIIAYATGLEPPKPRLSTTELTDARADRDPGRGFLQVAQLRHEGDWQPAPRAMPNLMRHLRETQKLDVALRPEELTFTSPDLFKYKFLYLHGRGRFAASDEGLENLRANLTTGGTLLADACCGSPGFDAAFRDFAGKLFPDAKLEPIPTGDVLYSADIYGAKIETVKLRTGTGAFEAQAPLLEGVKVGDRWAVIYSRFDIGCALEKHASGDCKGHDHDGALKIAGAAVLYMYKK
jgi:hypothetical protein